MRDRVTRLLGGTPQQTVVPSSPEPVRAGDEVAAPEADRPAAVLDPSRRGAAALTAVAVLAALVTAGLVWRSRPRPVAVVAPTVVAASAAGEAGRGQVVVDVQGAVRRPGLVTLPGGARVADALAAAGGVRPGASTRGLNLARRLTDGEQVVVLEPGAAPAAPTAGGEGGAGSAGAGGTGAGGTGGLLDLNLATLAQLDGLPGVGPVTAQRILAWRAEHGRFASVDQLREVEGIGDKRFETLRKLVVV